MMVRNFYAATGSQHAILKRGIRLGLLQLEQLLPANQVKSVKKRDIFQLLKAMGQNEAASKMNFYKAICDPNYAEDDNCDSDDTTEFHNEDNW